MSDFETVRRALEGYGTLNAEGRDALDRIEAEIEKRDVEWRALNAELRNERHRASVASTECAALHERLRDSQAEAERLRASRDAYDEEAARHAEKRTDLEAEVERLRADRDEQAKYEMNAWERANKRIKDAEAEVERLRALLESAPRGVGDDGPWLDWWRQVSVALAKEEA